MLLQAAENMKHKAKKSLAADKVQRLKTGGGTFVSQVDTIDEKLIQLLGHRAVPLDNPFDGDAGYCNEVQVYTDFCKYFVPHCVMN
jgi:hypothetical protein